MADKKPKKKISREIKKDIKKAVDILPELVSDNHEFVKPKVREEKTVFKKKEKQTIETTRQRYKTEKKKKQLLTTGVSILMVAILAIWGLSARAMVYDFGSIREQSQNFLNNLESNWQEAQAAVPPPGGTELEKALIEAERNQLVRDAIGNSLANLINTSVTSSSLENNVSSTMETTTSTENQN